MGEARSPGRLFGEAMRRVRQAKGWTTPGRLAEEVQALGFPTSRSTLSRLETGHRQPGLDEAFVVSAALGVSPLDLALPAEGAEVQVTPALVVPLAKARAWARGEEPLPGQTWEFMASQSPDFWIDTMTLRRQGTLRRLVQELAEAEEAKDAKARMKVLDAVEREVARQRSAGPEEV